MHDLIPATPGTVALWAAADPPERWTYLHVLAHERVQDDDGSTYWVPRVGGNLGLESVDHQWLGWEYIGLAHTEDLPHIAIPGECVRNPEEADHV